MSETQNIKNTEFDNLAVGQTSSLDFCITDAMIDQFGELTGDKSLLHMDTPFARRSQFRERVAHGMLPVSYLLLLDDFFLPNHHITFQKLSASFKNICVDGDQLTLTAKLTAKDEKSQKCDFEYAIEKVKNKTIVTSGLFSLKYVFRDSFHEDKSSAKNEMFLLKDLSPSVHSFEDIEKQDSESFIFCPSTIAIQSLIKLLRDGQRSDFNDSYESRCHAANFCAALLTSSFVGMCIPGRDATFLDVLNLFDQSLQYNQTYRLNGSVTFKSYSTRVISLKTSFQDVSHDDHILGEAVINTKVNLPPIRMPSFKEVKTQLTNFNLKGKVVLVTGASRGIGETTAKFFAAHGARVVVNYFKGQEDAKDIVNEIHQGGEQAIAVGGDVSLEEDVKVMIQTIVDQWGTIDILVNNAVRDARAVPFLETTWEDYQKDMDVTIKGAYLCSREVIPLMLKEGGGHIINVSTHYTEEPPAQFTKYVTSKSGLVGLTRSLASEFKGKNININFVSPRMVLTDLSKSASSAQLETLRETSPIDVAKAIINQITI